MTTAQGFGRSKFCKRMLILLGGIEDMLPMSWEQIEMYC